MDTIVQKKFGRWSVYFAGSLIAIALLVLIGWAFNVVPLRRPVRGLIAMNPVTALAFIFSGTAFLLYSVVAVSTWRGPLALILSLLVLVIGLTRLISVISGVDIPVDSLLFPATMNEEAISNIPTRMAPISAACFMLTGITLLFFGNRSPLSVKAAQVIVLLIGLVAVLSLVGYLYRVEAFYGMLTYIPVAIHTAICFLFFSIALLLQTSSQGIMKELTSGLAGSSTALRLIPAAIIIPVLLGLFRLWGDWGGLYSKEFGVTILVISIIIVFLVVISYHVILLNRKDQRRLEAERALKQSEQKFQKAFTGSPAGISLTRLSNQTFFDVNDSFLKMTGFSKEELLNRTSVQAGLIVEFEKREESYREIGEKGSIQNMEVTLRNKSGKPVEALCSLETISLDGEQFMLSIVYDISERKNTQRQLEEVNKELEAFSYSVSHDLRAPLRIIDGYTEILLSDHMHQLDDEGKRVLGVVAQNAQRMGNLIDDLLNLSRLGRKELLVYAVDMNSLVLSAMDELGLSPEKRSSVCVKHLETAIADSSLLKQVWINLLSNAIKYSGTREKPVIEISSEKKGTEVQYCIRDNGVGFNMQYADKLFGVFQRLHKITEFEGTGVGLALVHRIITKHGGKVWAEAEADKGASFYFTLPGIESNGRPVNEAGKESLKTQVL